MNAIHKFVIAYILPFLNIMSWTRIQTHSPQLDTPLLFSNRTHKLCTLPNGILTLLISDPDDTLSACSLSVAAGAHNDPLSLPGIAHLTEHMLLAGGSKRYPQLGEYHETISKYEGFHNAYTTGEQTTFYFELPLLATAIDTNTDADTTTTTFDTVADMLASSFKHPLFTTGALNKEVYAIASEHDANVANPSKLLYHGIRQLANPHHPFSRFSTGDMHTLARSSKLKRRVKHYFQDHMGSDRMTLCLRGPQSIHSLAALALSKFGDIPAGARSSGPGTPMPSPAVSPSPSLTPPPAQPRKWEIGRPGEADPHGLGARTLERVWLPQYHGVPCFLPAPHHNAVHIVPPTLADRRVRYVWPVDRVESPFGQREVWLFSAVWAELLGDESPGSLCARLVSLGWATGCAAFVSEFSVRDTGLVLELMLTESGWEQRSLVSACVMQRMRAVLDPAAEAQCAQFLRTQDVADLIAFVHRAKPSSPMDEASELSARLLENLGALDARNLLRGQPTFADLGGYADIAAADEGSAEVSEWWAGVAARFTKFVGDYTAWSNVRVVSMGPRDPGQRDDDYDTDEHYRYDYREESLREPEAMPTDDHSFSPFPDPNPFIPSWCASPQVLHQLVLQSTLESRFASLQPGAARHGSAALSRLQIPRLAASNGQYSLWALEDPELAAPTSRKCAVTLHLQGEGTPSPLTTLSLEVLVHAAAAQAGPALYASQRLGYVWECDASEQGGSTLRVTVCGFAEGVPRLVRGIVRALQDAASATTLSSAAWERARAATRAAYDSAASDNALRVASVGLLVLLERHMWPPAERLRVLEEMTREEYTLECAALLRAPRLTLFVQGDMPCGDTVSRWLSDDLTGHLRPGAVGSTSPSPAYVPHTVSLPPGCDYYYEHERPASTNALVYFLQTGPRWDPRTRALTHFTAYLMSLSLHAELRSRRQVAYVVLGGTRELTDTMGLHVSLLAGSAPSELELRVGEYLCYLEHEVLARLDKAAFQQHVQTYLAARERTAAAGNGDKSSADESVGGPADLLQEVAPTVRAGDIDADTASSASLHRHRRLARAILQGQGNNHPQDRAQADREELGVLRRLTLREYARFYCTYVSVHSPDRSKLSVRVVGTSGESDDGDGGEDDSASSDVLLVQLQAFLRMAGVLVDTEALRKAVAAAGEQGSNAALVRGILRSLGGSRPREAWRLARAVLRAVLQARAAAKDASAQSKNGPVYCAAAAASTAQNPRRLATPDALWR
ncbi:Axl1 protein [Maudiozyma humilis]|uniref:Axl1 protein n=1 Tax=Maudiozyma humilis TaxID=51915 RepID=A0AAV5S2Q8_MAUHU|nr:Axl1 protein [Kazachstania humilis]